MQHCLRLRAEDLAARESACAGVALCCGMAFSHVACHVTACYVVAVTCCWLWLNLLVVGWSAECALFSGLVVNWDVLCWKCHGWAAMGMLQGNFWTTWVDCMLVRSYIPVCIYRWHERSLPKFSWWQYLVFGAHCAPCCPTWQTGDTNAGKASLLPLWQW